MTGSLDMKRCIDLDWGWGNGVGVGGTGHSIEWKLHAVGGGYECTGLVQVNITFNKIKLGFCSLFVFSIELVINEW